MIHELKDCQHRTHRLNDTQRFQEVVLELRLKTRVSHGTYWCSIDESLVRTLNNGNSNISQNSITSLFHLKTFYFCSRFTVLYPSPVPMTSIPVFLVNRRTVGPTFLLPRLNLLIINYILRFNDLYRLYRIKT